MSKTTVTMFKLMRDGDEVYRGTEIEVTAWIHRNHSFSASHALQYEGYTMVPFERELRPEEISTRLRAMGYPYNQLDAVRLDVAATREFLNRAKVPSNIAYVRDHNLATAVNHLVAAKKRLADVEREVGAVKRLQGVAQ